MISAQAPATTIAARIHEAGTWKMVNTQPTISDSGATSAHLSAMTPRVGRGSESLNLGGSPHYLGRGVFFYVVFTVTAGKSPVVSVCTSATTSVTNSKESGVISTLPGSSSGSVLNLASLSVR